MLASARRHGTVLALLWLGAALGGGFARAQDRVLVFAPEVSPQLADAPFHGNGAKRLCERLAQGGISSERIVRLEGSRATAERFWEELGAAAGTAPPSGLLLVILCAPGFQIGDADYLCAADTPVDVAGELAQGTGRVLPLARVLREMDLSASGKRVLIVDPIGPSDSLADAGARFGRLDLSVSKGQTVVTNRSARLNARDGQPPITDFVCALLDGLSVHADGNRDGSVSLLELVAYLKLYADDRRDPDPRVASNLDDDFALVATSADTDQAFPREKLHANAKRLIAEAEKALLFDTDIEATLTLLDRAERLCYDADLKARIDEMFASARLLNGEADSVLPTAAVARKRWTAVVPRGCGLHEEAAPKATKSLPAGTLVEIALRSERHAWVMSAVAPRWNNGGLKLEPLEIKPGWIPLRALQADPSSSVPNEYLKERLARVFDNAQP